MTLDRARLRVRIAVAVECVRAAVPVAGERVRDAAFVPREEDAVVVGAGMRCAEVLEERLLGRRGRSAASPQTQNARRAHR